MNGIVEKLQQQKEILESQGYKVAYICLYGSQNYGLDIYTDEYQSDIDMKAVIVPTLEDLITNSKPISTTIKTEWGECDLKDIRSYMETVLKANPAYIETLFTKYFIIDNKFKTEFETIRLLAEELVHTLRAQFIRAMYGMMCEKEKALCHPYPTIAHKIEKDGYDGKQASHTYRLWLMMNDYFKNGAPYSQCFFPSEEFKNELISLKLNKYSLEYVKSFMSTLMELAKEFRQDVLSQIDESKIDYSIKEKLILLSQQIIKNKIINEIVGVSK